MIEVKNAQSDASVLRLVCSGIHGTGSGGNESATRITQAVSSALAASGVAPAELELDFRAVEYEWGDGPVSSIVPFMDRFQKVRIVSSPQNVAALKGLVEASGFAELIAIVE
jgi:hypothetical protein